MTMARSCVYYVFQMMLARKPVEASWPSISALQPLHCWKKVRKSANDLELHMSKRNLVWSVSNQQGFALIKHQCKMWWWGNRIGLPSKGKIVRIRLQWEDDRYSPAANSPHLMVRNQRIGSFETMMIQTLVGIVSLISFNLVRSRWCSMMFNASLPEADSRLNLLSTSQLGHHAKRRHVVQNLGSGMKSKKHMKVSSSMPCKWEESSHQI